MNNLKEYARLNNDDKKMNDTGELNTEELKAADNEASDKSSIGELMDDSCESHFSPYEDLYNDSALDFE